ncbi:MAG: hypothetical protein ABEI52_03745 [Halobacteriaceae archaeon]
MAAVEPIAGSLKAFLVTIFAGWIFFTFTAQVAATFFLGDSPWSRALIIGAIPAMITSLLIRYPPLVIISIGLSADLLAILKTYGTSVRVGILITIFHYAVSIGIVIIFSYLAALLSTAPT